MAALWLLKHLYKKEVQVDSVFVPQLVVRNSAIQKV